MNALAHILSKVLIPPFFLGMIGSLLVVVLTLIRDLRQVSTSDDTDNGLEL